MDGRSRYLFDGPYTINRSQQNNDFIIKSVCTGEAFKIDGESGRALFGEDISVVGVIHAQDLSVSGTHNIVSASPTDLTLSGDLSVDGNSSLTDVSIFGELSVTGVTHLQDLSVSGSHNLVSAFNDLTLSGGLEVQGQSDLSTAVLTGKLTGTDASFSANLSAQDVTILNDIDATAGVMRVGDLSVNGVSNIGGGLGKADDVTWTGDHEFQAAVDFSTIISTGVAQLNDLSVSGDSNISVNESGDYTWTGDHKFEGLADFSTIVVDGSIDASGAIDCSVLVVDKAASVGTTISAADASVTGAVHGADVSATSTIGGTDISISGDIDMDGQIDCSVIIVDGSVDISGALDCSVLVVNKGATIGTSVSAVDISATGSVNGTDISATNTIGCTDVSASGVIAGSDLSVTGDIDAAGSICVGGAIYTDESFDVSKIVADGSIDCSGAIDCSVLVVDSSVEIGGDIDCTSSVLSVGDLSVNGSHNISSSPTSYFGQISQYTGDATGDDEESEFTAPHSTIVTSNTDVSDSCRLVPDISGVYRIDYNFSVEFIVSDDEDIESMVFIDGTIADYGRARASCEGGPGHEVNLSATLLQEISAGTAISYGLECDYDMTVIHSNLAIERIGS